MDYLSQLTTSFNIITFFIFSTIIILLLKYIIFPYIKFINKQKQLESRYKVYIYPFRPLGFSFMKKFIDDFKYYRDSMYTRKIQFPKYEIALTNIRDRPVIILTNEGLIQQFIDRQNQGYYNKTNSGVHYLSFKQFLREGLLLSEGKQWRYKRKILSQFFNYQFIKSKFSMFVGIAKQICEKYKQNKDNNGMVYFQSNSIFQEIFGTIVLRCFFGFRKLQPIYNQNIFHYLSKLLLKIADRNIRISSFLFGEILFKYGIRKIDREIIEEIRIFREYSKNVIHNIIQQINNNNDNKESQGLVAKLIRQNKYIKNCTYDQKIQKAIYTQDDLVNQLVTFFFAGTDTTTSTISQLIIRIFQYPQIQQKIRKEIKEVFNDDINNITIQGLKKLNYLRYCQAEILRMNPAVPFIILRQAQQDHKIGEIKIKKGDYVTHDILASHYNPNIYKDPYEYRPQRWLELQNAPNIGRNYLPFSQGSRSCIGQQLSLIQGRLAIVMILLNFRNGKCIESEHKYRLQSVYGIQNTQMRMEITQN